MVIPNKEYLKGKPSEMQTIFFWLCDHADEYGICYPSRKTISKEAGCSIRTVDKYITQLEQAGFIDKTYRINEVTGSKDSNLYQINIMVEQDSPEGSDVKNTTPSVENIALTIPNINSTHRTIIADVIPSTESPSVEEILIENIDLGKKLILGALPENRGSTRIQRITSIYQDLFRYKYGIFPTLLMIKVGSCIDILCKTYTELQISAMMISFFEWKGMSGDDMFEQNRLQEATHPFSWFYSSINKYEIYLRNVHGLKFDDEKEVKKFVGTFMLSIQK